MAEQKRKIKPPNEILESIAFEFPLTKQPQPRNKRNKLEARAINAIETGNNMSKEQTDFMKNINKDFTR